VRAWGRSRENELEADDETLRQTASATYSAADVLRETMRG
jgi:hypothetical protein